MRSISILLALAVSMSGCVAVVPSLMGLAGTGAVNAKTASADEARLVDLTAKNFGVDATKVRVFNIKAEGGSFAGVLNGMKETYFDAKVDGKDFKCYSVTTGIFSGDTGSVRCAKPGEQINKGPM